ncbi:hypothetical protein BDA99DRAFT_539075 [Phascolomyces articulosus]|uniref:RING-type domain-containing protein n=1 Tax=Phascolomyces articulosus TaxID=60185 RepID=A0AAD5PCM6_9FUNG|nr:hypothetical protein BDA99DRAFT_539075 [Phascolomyces articulosus]
MNNNNNNTPRRSSRLCRSATRYDPMNRNGRQRNQDHHSQQTEEPVRTSIRTPSRPLRRSRRLNPEPQQQEISEQQQQQQQALNGLPVSPSSLLRNVLEVPSRVTGPAMLADVITQAVVNAYRDRRNNNNNNNSSTATTNTTENNDNNNRNNNNNGNNNDNDVSVSTSPPMPTPAFDPSLLDITPDANSEENSFFRFVRLPLLVPSDTSSEVVMPMFIVGYRTQQEVTSTPPEHLQHQHHHHSQGPTTSPTSTTVEGRGGEGTAMMDGEGGLGTTTTTTTDHPPLRRSQRLRELQQRRQEEEARNDHRRYTVSRWIIYFISGMDHPNYDDLVAAWQADHRNTGITVEQIDTCAPQQPFSHEMIATLIGASEQCHVCLEKFELLENVRILPCKHGFHQECIDKWLMEAQNRCPLCRNTVVPASLLS